MKSITAFPSIGKGQKNNSTDVVLKSNGTYLIYDHATGESHSFNPEWSQINAERDAAQMKSAVLKLSSSAKLKIKPKSFNSKQKPMKPKRSGIRHSIVQIIHTWPVAGIKPINARTMPVVKTSGGQTFTDPLIIPLFDVHTHEIVNLQFITP